MAEFEYRAYVPQDPQAVFDWFSRAGALRRLFPPFGGHVVDEPKAGLAVGSEAKLLIAAPGVMGTAASAVGESVAGLTKRWGLPARWSRPEVSWTARHTALEPPHMFRDEMVSGPLESWTHTHCFEAQDGGTQLFDRVEYELPARVPAALTSLASGSLDKELQRTFAYRHRQVRDDLAFHDRYAQSPRLRVGITGASGFIGTQLSALLTTGGHTVHAFTRGKDWDPTREFIDLDVVRGLDVVIHLAGQSIGGRFTAQNKKEILGSRVSGTRAITRALALAGRDGQQRTLISASAVGFYGSHPHREQEHGEISSSEADAVPLTEDHAAGSDFLAEVCARWEAEANAAATEGVRVVVLRTGVVLSPDGGLLARILPLFAAGVGGPMAKGAWNSWISRDDLISMYAHAALTPSLAGTFNAVAPHPVTSEEFAETLGKVMRRPAKIPTPAFGPKLLLGGEGAEELAFASQRTSAEKIQRAGFLFRHPTLEVALRHVLGGQDAASS